MMETSIIIYVLLGLAVVILLYTTFNLLRKNEKAEDIIVSQREFIEKFQESIEFTQEKLDKIDERGTFKSDDEIGWFFNEIKVLQEGLSQFKTKS